MSYLLILLCMSVSFLFYSVVTSSAFWELWKGANAMQPTVTFYYMNLCSLWNFHHNHYSESLLFIIPTCPQAGDHTQSLDHASQVLIHTPITLITQGWVAASLLQGSGLWSILPKNRYHHSPSCELSMQRQVLDLPFGHPLVTNLHVLASVFSSTGKTPSFLS